MSGLDGWHGKKNENEPLLSARTGTLSAEFLGLHPAGVCNQQGPVVGDEFFLELDCTGRVVVLCVVGDDCLCDCLADCVDLGGVTTALYTDADVDGLEGVLADDEDGLVDLEAEDLWLEEVDGRAVYFDEALAFAGVGDCRCGLDTVSAVLDEEQRECAPSSFRMSARRCRMP